MAPPSDLMRPAWRLRQPARVPEAVRYLVLWPGMWVSRRIYSAQPAARCAHSFLALRLTLRVLRVLRPQELSGPTSVTKPRPGISGVLNKTCRRSPPMPTAVLPRQRLCPHEGSRHTSGNPRSGTAGFRATRAQRCNIHVRLSVGCKSRMQETAQ